MAAIFLLREAKVEHGTILACYYVKIVYCIFWKVRNKAHVYEPMYVYEWM